MNCVEEIIKIISVKVTSPDLLAQGKSLQKKLREVTYKRQIKKLSQAQFLFKI